uniref:Uncharacterized protein n=1 Tax=Anguilla anguilla TaxID=7936 RepID=A0A0E9QXZ1_ANGAN
MLSVAEAEMLRSHCVTLSFELPFHRGRFECAHLF